MAEDRVERRLAAILAADVVGYTRLMGSDEAGTLRRLIELRQQVLEPLIAEHHGRVVKLIGDGLLVEFASVVDALTCAVAWQNDVAAREAETDEDRRLQFRIGVNIGDIIVEGDDIYGDGVNIAARLEGLAEPGGICFSGDAYRQTKGKIEAAFEDMGEQHLKNVAEPTRVYRIAGNASIAISPYASAASFPLPDKPSIAALPFTNMSGDPEQEYFSDGITEDIITELSRFSSLFVIARNSSFAYKGQSVDVRQIAKELGVRYLLEGSIRRAGNRIRITAQLVDSVTGNHIWAERYDRMVDDIFDLQEEITRNVVASIAPQIEMAEIERVRGGQSKSFSAYDLALKAKAILFDGIRSLNPEVMEQAIEVAEEALAIDSRNVQALWTQGFAYHMLCTWGAGSDPEELTNLAFTVVKRLSEIDSTNPYCCMILGIICWDRGEHDQAIDHLRRGYRLNPNFAWNLISLAWCESLAGFTEEARDHAELGLRLSPRDMDFWLGTAYLALAQAHLADANFEKAKKMSKLGVELNAKARLGRSLAIASCAHLGDAEEAAHHLRELRSFAPEFLASLLDGKYTLYAIPEDNALLVEGIKKEDLPE